MVDDLLLNPDWRRHEQRFGWKTYAQHFDDGMLVNIFDLLNHPKPSYLDLGAHHPLTISNTQLLYERGSRGVNVEANPNLMEMFRKYRPEDLNLNLGVGRERCRLPFYMIDDTSGLNSFCLAEIEGMGMKPQRTIEIDVVSPMEIVTLCPGGVFPDILLTDIEGHDHEVLAACDFSKSRPKVICSEIRPHYSLMTKRMLQTRGFFPYCRMSMNLIFVHGDLIEKLY